MAFALTASLPTHTLTQPLFLAVFHTPLGPHQTPRDPQTEKSRRMTLLTKRKCAGMKGFAHLMMMLYDIKRVFKGTEKKKAVVIYSHSCRWEPVCVCFVCGRYLEKCLRGFVFIRWKLIVCLSTFFKISTLVFWNKWVVAQYTAYIVLQLVQ